MNKWAVWKFDLKLPGYGVPPVQLIEMPQGAEINSVGLQAPGTVDSAKGRPQLPKLVLWATVMCDAPKVKRRIRVLATGEASDVTVPMYGTFVDTVQLDVNGQEIVFHVFDFGEAQV